MHYKAPKSIESFYQELRLTLTLALAVAVALTLIPTLTLFPNPQPPVITSEETHLLLTEISVPNPEIIEVCQRGKGDAILEAVAGLAEEEFAHHALDGRRVRQGSTEGPEGRVRGSVSRGVKG